MGKIFLHLGSIILYGRNIDCYSALAMFLRSDLEGSNIILVEPVVDICETQNANFFGNDEVNAEIFLPSG